MTGASVRDVVIQNGLVKVTYEVKTPDSEKGAHTLYRWDGSAYTRATTTQYGDWSFFVVGFTVVADRAIVLEASSDLVEVAFEWTTFSIGSGVPDYDSTPSLNYASGQSGANYKKILSTKLTKVIKVMRGREGYFAAWHSTPRVGPSANLIPAYNNETAWGERELGTGGGNRVSFASTGNSCLHPDWGADSRGWIPLGFTGAANRPMWPGIDDSQAYGASASLQPAGFPADASSGPWWLADLHAENATTYPFCRYVILRQRLECGFWQFGDGQYGATVVHFTNEASDDSGIPYRYMVFIGAFPYTSPSLSAEPTTALKQRVAARAPSNFEDAGNADDNGVEFMTAASVRDELIAAVEAISA